MRKLLAALAVLLAGCAAPEITGPKGYVAYSLLTETAFGQAYLLVRPVGHEGGGRNVGLFMTDAFSMQTVAGTSGVVKAVAFKPGTYELYNFFMEDGSRTQWRSRQDFALRFQVKPGEVTYLGEFRATRTRTKDLVDWLKGPTPYFLWADHRARDIGLAAKATPEVQGLPAHTVRFEAVKPTPFVRTTRVD
jgi:hypothetical protein